MKEHLVALVYILLLSGVSFAVMAKPMTASLMAPADFIRRRNLWIAVTIITFLSHDFWLGLLLSSIIVAIAAQRDENPTALYCVLLLAAPQFDMKVPGFGLVNWLFEINHPKTMALVLLLPASLRLAGSRHVPNHRLRMADRLFLSYFFYISIINATAGSITGIIRDLVNFALDHGLLYYVVTRSVTTRRKLYEVLASFTMGLAALGLISGFEALRHWLLYESLRAPLGVPPASLGSYLVRATEDGGYLRSYATAGQAIALGVMAMLALTFQFALGRLYGSRLLGVATALLPFCALVASVSRGPWVACAIAVLIGVAFGPAASKRLAIAAAGVLVVISGLFLIPQGHKVIDLLPFVGSVEPGSATYRAQLLERGMAVFWLNPVFGSLGYIFNPLLEDMRQGQGIIDIVNAYLGVALAYGSIGLVLFIANALYALISTWSVGRQLSHLDDRAEAAGRTLWVSLLGFLFAISAVSFIFHIATVYWWLVSLCIAFAAHAPSWGGREAECAPVVTRGSSSAAFYRWIGGIKVLGSNHLAH